MARAALIVNDRAVVARLTYGILVPARALLRPATAKIRCRSQRPPDGSGDGGNQAADPGIPTFVPTGTGSRPAKPGDQRKLGEQLVPRNSYLPHTATAKPSA